MHMYVCTYHKHSHIQRVTQNHEYVHWYIGKNTYFGLLVNLLYLSCSIISAKCTSTISHPDSKSLLLRRYLLTINHVSHGSDYSRVKLLL